MDFTYTSALIIQHCAVMGRLETPVRAYRLNAPQHVPTAVEPKMRVSVAIDFLPPRKRHGARFTMYQDHLRYLTIETSGQVVYDSRTDVPCDMEAWTATNARFAQNRPLQTISGRDNQRRYLEGMAARARP